MHHLWAITCSTSSDGVGQYRCRYLGSTLTPVSIDTNWTISTNGLDFSPAKVAHPGIYLNGNLLPGTATYGYAFSSNQAFSIAVGSSFFAQGINELEIRGYSVNNLWDAFWIAADVQGEWHPCPAHLIHAQRLVAADQNSNAADPKSYVPIPRYDAQEKTRVTYFAL